jgi:hypothetical protein
LRIVEHEGYELYQALFAWRLDEVTWRLIHYRTNGRSQEWRNKITSEDYAEYQQQKHTTHSEVTPSKAATPLSAAILNIAAHSSGRPPHKYAPVVVFKRPRVLDTVLVVPTFSAPIENVFSLSNGRGNHISRKLCRNSNG